MVCPFLEKPFRDCGPNLTMENIDKAVMICGDEFCNCPIFKKNYQKKKFSLKKLVTRKLFKSA
jgi:hypothetical protein